MKDSKAMFNTRAKDRLHLVSFKPFLKTRGVSHGDRQCSNTILFRVYRNGYKIQNRFAVVINYAGELKLVRQTFSEPYNLHIYSS